MDSTCADVNLSNNKSTIQDEYDNSTDDKISVYETIISGRYIKQEPCDMENERANFHNYVDIKDENIEDLMVVIKETGLKTYTEQNYLKYCEECGEEYDLYCLKCPMLIRIFDSNNPSPLHNSIRRTLPIKFLDICEILSGMGIVALRPLPKGVVFGPFEGLDSTMNGTVSKWKLKNNELAYTKDPKRLNWMQYIRRADPSCPQNLTPFQYEDGLYYRSDCHISVGDELLVSWESDSKENMIEGMGDSYLKPQVFERLGDTYACMLCCVGYKSICHLAAHNSSCPEKGNQTDFCKEIIQCVFCKIYLDEKEYSDYHIDRCCGKNSKKCVATPRFPEDTDKPGLKNKYKCSMCEYSTSRKSMFRQHQLTHTDDLQLYKCPECLYRTSRKHGLQKHMRTHDNSSRSRFECKHCGERFARFDIFAIHQKKKHSVLVYKCDKCVFETANSLDLRQHRATHKDDKPYHCNTCGKQFRINDSLVAHVKIYHNEKKKEYKCPKCDFESFYPAHLKTHLLNIHSGVKRFKCPRCTFKTCYKQHLERHLRFHEEAKPMKCEYCDMEFWNTRSFVRHKKERHLTHNDDKPFACTLCPYKTTKKFNLKQHFAIHGDDKPFKCDACPHLLFKYKSSLMRHARNVHSETDKTEYKCPQCNFNTRHKGHFTRHTEVLHVSKVKKEKPVIESDD